MHVGISTAHHASLQFLWTIFLLLLLFTWSIIASPHPEHKLHAIYPIVCFRTKENCAHRALSVYVHKNADGWEMLSKIYSPSEKNACAVVSPATALDDIRPALFYIMHLPCVSGVHAALSSEKLSCFNFAATELFINLTACASLEIFARKQKHAASPKEAKLLLTHANRCSAEWGQKKRGGFRELEKSLLTGGLKATALSRWGLEPGRAQEVCEKRRLWICTRDKKSRCAQGALIWTEFYLLCARLTPTANPPRPRPSGKQYFSPWRQRWANRIIFRSSWARLAYYMNLDEFAIE